MNVENRQPESSISREAKGRTADAPLILSVEMGYGHLRVAHALADRYGVDPLRLDRPPLCNAVQTLFWKAVLRWYASLSRAGAWPLIGPAASSVLAWITHIESPPRLGLHEPPGFWTWIADAASPFLLSSEGRARCAAAPLGIIATYPLAAFACLRIPGAQVFCLATDSDLNRAWAPANPADSAITYFAPTGRVVDRLISFGVRPERIHLTGFPLPASLVAGAERALGRRLRRLDPRSAFYAGAPEECRRIRDRVRRETDSQPLSLMVAIGGAGAQIDHVGQLLNSLGSMVRSGALRISLIAGVRRNIARILATHVSRSGLSDQVGRSVEILVGRNLPEYFRLFDECIAKADLLWTKPSELSFYAALGLPILLSPPVGVQEEANREWLLANGAALSMENPSCFAAKLEQLLADGQLCRIAWEGYQNLSRDGLARIVELVSAISPV